MDSGNIWLVITLICLLFLSGFFSSSETAFSSLNKIRLKSMAADGNKKAARTLELAEDSDKLLSSILIGNNIVNILSSALATILFVGWFGGIGVTLATVVMTVLVLIMGEITPKTLAKEFPEGVAMAVTPLLTVFVTIFTPLSALFASWKKVVLKMLKISPDNAITEQELLTYVEEVREDGAITEEEEELIRSVIEFDDVEVADISTPRVDIEAISADTPNKEIAALFYETGFSRLPVYAESVDNIIGVLLQKDFHYAVETLHRSVKSVIRPVIHVTESMKISDLLKELQQKKTHLAVVEDEYGGTQGIVTMEDIIEELVGEIWDEYDEVQEDIKQISEDEFAIQGSAETEKVFEEIGILCETDYNTIGGWVSEQVGHIPEEGESFEYGNAYVTVKEMDRNRVAEVVLKILPEQEPVNVAEPTIDE